MSEVRIQGRTVGGLAVALVSATFALSGCSSHQGAVAAATASEVPVVATVAPEASPTGPAVGASSRQQDLDTAISAERAVRRYVDEVNGAYATLNVKGLLALSEPGCTTCARYVASVRNLVTQGQRVVTGSITTQQLVSPGRQTRFHRTVVATSSFSDFVVAAASGQNSKLETKNPHVVQSFDLVLVAGQWRVAEIRDLSP